MNRLERIAEARASALEALTRASGTDSLCTLAREHLPAAKYHEGAVAALGEALRAARRGDAQPDPKRWGLGFAAYAEVDVAWRAYLTGGRDALTALAEGSRSAADGAGTSASALAPGAVRD